MKVLRTLVLCLTAVLISAPTLAASDADKEAILNDTPYYGADATCASSGPAVTPGPIYIVGDSITVRMQDALTQKLTGAGWQPKINAVVSRPLRNASFSGGDGFQAVDQDAAFIKTAKAIVVELGTNPSGDFSTDLKSFIAKLRSLNQDASIYWANLASNKPDNNYLTAISVENQAITTQSAALNYQIIDWFHAVFPNGDPANMSSSLSDNNHYLDTSDGLNVHPTVPTGVNAYANLIGKTLSSLSSPDVGASSCSCPTPDLSGENNVQMSFNYFVGKGLTDAQSAGIVGNFQQESGQDIDPTLNGASGLGIAQWLSGRRDQAFTMAKLTHQDVFSLQLQLQFVWWEMTGQPSQPSLGTPDGGAHQAYDLIKADQTARNAAAHFAQYYERPASSDYTPREDNADRVLQQYGGSGSGGTADSCGSVTGYRNPFWKIPSGDLNPLRIDQGVDYGREGDIYAIGPALVELVLPGESGWGTVNSGDCVDSRSAAVMYRFTSGAATGKIVFVVECFTVNPDLKEGQHIDSGTLIGHMYGPIEIGWGVLVPKSTPPGSLSYNQANAHYQPYCSPPFQYENNGAPSVSTLLGINFSQFLQKLGAPPGIMQASGTGGCLPAGWPKWQ